MEHSVNDAVNDSRTDSLPSRAPADLGIREHGSREHGARDQGSLEANSSPARTNGSADARENPPAQAAPQPNLDDDTGPWLVGYRLDRIARTALLLGFKPPVTDLMRRKRWAVLVAGEGWAIPITYLAFVERLLAGCDPVVELFDVEGAPTPGQRDRERVADRRGTAGVLAELRAAQQAAEADPEATDRARREARQAFAEASARMHPEPPPESAAEAVSR